MCVMGRGLPNDSEHLALSMLHLLHRNKLRRRLLSRIKRQVKVKPLKV